jgi:hypothetical protein
MLASYHLQNASIGLIGLEVSTQEVIVENLTRKSVEQYYQAWRSGDVNSFPFSHDFTFDGPMLSFSSPQGFKEMAAQFAPMVKEVNILDSSYAGNKAFVLLEFATNIPEVGSWTSIDYFVVEGDKIKYSRTVYDPRKLAQYMQSR